MLSHDLASGVHGVTFGPPPSWELVKDEPHALQCVDRAAGVGWFIYVMAGLHLDLAREHEALLRRDAERHAAWLSDWMWRADAAAGMKMPETKSPRAPLVSLELLSVGGAPAVSLLHRMAYRPAREIVMGHLLVPLAQAVFEARWVVSANQTGYRESVLLLEAQRNAPNTAPAELMSVVDFDAEEHDAAFPGHPLTVARAAARFIARAAGIVVSAPAPTRTQCEAHVASLGFSFVPPPRFVRDDDDPTLFRRLSIATTDGVEMLIVEGGPRTTALADDVVEHARKAYVASGVNAVEARRLDQDDALPCAVVEGEGHLGPLRMVTCGRDLGAERRFLSLATTTAQPADSMAAELRQAMTTARS